MTAFSYRGGALSAESVSLEALAAEVGTPFYVYSTAQLQANYKNFADAFAGEKPLICYAVKANANQAVIQTLAACGAGADITSIGEMERALAAGVHPEKIVFSGVGKDRNEITAALIAGLHQLNVESIPELRLISQVAVELGRTAPVALRVNPDVAAGTWDKTATGHKESKFGIEPAQLDEAVKLATTLPDLAFKGFAMHIGSNVSDHGPFRIAFERLARLVQDWRTCGVTIERLDLGGGLNIPYRGEKVASLADYAKLVRDILGPLNCKLAFEPGRLLVGTAGMLVSRVTHAKKAVTKNFLIIDAGMNDLVRPAMYGARHGIQPVRESSASRLTWDVVGPVCETADLFGEAYELPDLAAGDLVAIAFAGAYGSAMASAYNGRALIPEIMVSGGDYAVVRRRISVAEQMGWEALPPWAASAQAG
ncbi:MAG: diaminopimelate decarboxylase [Alphaproteobacteria bacterium]|nr:diaminopimelate decarboxylase [Alphaproteobacteria bacterium]